MDNAAKDFIFVGPNIFSDLDRGTQKTAIEISRTRSLFLSLAIRRRKAENARRLQGSGDTANPQTPASSQVAPPSLTPLSPTRGNKQSHQLSAAIPANFMTFSPNSSTQTCTCSGPGDKRICSVHLCSSSTSPSPLPLEIASPSLRQDNLPSKPPVDVDLCSREQLLLLECKDWQNRSS